MDVNIPVLMYSLLVGVWGVSGIVTVVSFLWDVYGALTYDGSDHGTTQASAVFIVSTAVALIFLVLGVV